MEDFLIKVEYLHDFGVSRAYHEEKIFLVRANDVLQAEEKAQTRIEHECPEGETVKDFTFEDLTIE